LLHHPVSRLLEVCDEVIVVLAPDVEEPSMPAGMRVEFARDANEGEGPLRGLSAGLEVANAEWVVLAGGDMPDLQPAVLREMLRAARETGVVAVTLSDGGTDRPLPSVLRTVPATDAARALLEAGRRSLQDLLAVVATVVVDEPTWTVAPCGTSTSRPTWTADAWIASIDAARTADLRVLRDRAPLRRMDGVTARRGGAGSRRRLGR